MKILLLGASSCVGARLYFDLKDTFRITGTYFNHLLSQNFLRLDITDATQVGKITVQVKPDVIIHAANNANAGWCEAHPEQARQLNELSTQSIVGAANTVNAKLIYVSSYTAIQPTNVYSRTKRASEEIIKKAHAGWVILRPSLIVGFSPNTTNDRSFNRLLQNLDAGTKAEYDTSWKFQPTWLGHISETMRAVLYRVLTRK